MPQTTRPISLLGLQIDEEIVIDASGAVWRASERPDRDSSVLDPRSRLMAATAFAINRPEDVFAVARFLVEILRAVGQPFDLHYYCTVDAEGELVEDGDVQRILWTCQRRHDHQENPDSKDDAPETPEIEWDSRIYYEAHFAVFRRPL